MPHGFRTTESHIAQALAAHGLAPSDALCDQLFAFLDIPAVERAALRGSDGRSQALHAQAEIWAQYQRMPTVDFISSVVWKHAA